MGADLTGLTMDSGMSLTEIIIALSVLAAFIIFIVIINSVKKTPGGKSGGGSGLSNFFAVYRIARDTGMNYEQRKMMSYAFKIDAATDPEKSVATPDLLDRHFRRAYRAIEQNSRSPKDALHGHAVLFSTRNLLENSLIGGVSSTRQLREDTTLSIGYGKDRLNVNVLSSKAEQLTVDTPKNILGSLIKIPKGTKVTVMFFTKNNKGFSFESRVAGFSTLHGRPTMLLLHSNRLKFLSQRRYRRRHSALACYIHVVYVEGSGKKQRLVVDKRRMNGTINDISVGGCSIKTTAPVKVGARLKIEFSQGDDDVAALGQDLRTNRTGINTVIHVKFIRITQKSMNLINAFVYEYINE
jgi:c-di-GMP-binding flagellar brake protein YcgR